MSAQNGNLRDRPESRASIRKDVVIIGAGASGLMCAIEAGKRKRSVIVLEHMSRTGRKIRVSGGGRCNFTNRDLGPEKYLSENPHFCKSALSRFSQYDFIGMLERHGIEYTEEEDGRFFCTRTAGNIVGMFQDECRRAGVEIRTNCKVTEISPADRFMISTTRGKIEAGSLVIATGGLSYPELGATDIGLRIAGRFGIGVTGVKPALVPLVYGKADTERFGELSGVSFDASVRCGKIRFRGKVLFTHRGLSGPAVLQVSSYWEKGSEITIDLLPGEDACELLLSRHRNRMELSNLLSGYLPRRLSRRWSELYAGSGPLCRYTEKELRDIAYRLHHWIIRPAGTEGYRRAEVTRGGIDTRELSSKTMESKKVPGLYFVGEVLDMAGQLGGYNLQWAWSSGFAAGQYA